ncbi:MAG: hypothetical protein FD167_1209 [bacterium]|nr:MAG: hypothetical protein FD167_1209 [bacterium]
MSAIEDITPFNGATIKIKGSGCLFNITGDEKSGYLVTLGLLISPTINAQQYDLQGNPVGKPFPLPIDSPNEFWNDTKNVSTKIIRPIDPTPASRLISFSFMPNLSYLYSEAANLGFNEELYIDWSKIPYKMGFHIDGQFSTYNLGVCSSNPEELINMIFYNKGKPLIPTLDFGDVGKNIGSTIELSPNNLELFYLDLESKIMLSSYDMNLYTAIEIESCLGKPIEEPFTYYYDKQIIEFINEKGKITPIEPGTGIFSKITNCQQIAMTDKVYCSPLVLSANHS